MAIIWKDPPPPYKGNAGGGYVRFRPLLEPLRERPGAWGVIRTYADSRMAASAAQSIRRRYPEFDATARVTDDRGSELYARFIGRTNG